VRRFLGKFSFLAAILLVAGFAYFTYAITKPVTSVQKPTLVRGTVRPAAALGPDAPFVRYVALHPGRPSAAGVPEHPLDDQVTADDGTFELRADEIDGTRFYLLARIETAREEFWCEIIELPPVRFREHGTWVEAATQAPLEPVRVTVDRSRRCG
jgi:hypothetical protein